MPTYVFGSFCLDVAQRSLLQNGRVVKLPKKLFEILVLLVESNGQPLTKEELMSKVWREALVEESNLTVSVSRLRQILKDDKQEPKYIVTLPCWGYRFIAQVRSVRPRTLNSIAVLPFENINEEIEYLAGGLTEFLIYSLSKLPDLRVIPRSSVSRYKGKSFDPIKVANHLDVDWLVSGSFLLRGQDLAISVELLDTGCNEILWGDRYVTRTSDFLNTQHHIIGEITEKLKLKQREGSHRLTTSNEAYQFYLRGRFQWTKRSEEYLKSSVDCLKWAITEDPHYALAYAGLADSFNLLGFYGIMAPQIAFEQAKVSALKALAIDRSLAEAHASLGFAKFHYDWDCTGAESCFKKSIELNGNYVTARLFYASQLVAMERFEEAICEYKRALELEPHSLIANAALGYGYYFARRYDDTIAQCRVTTEMDENFEIAHVWLGWAYQQKGMLEEAILEFEKALALSGGRPGIIADIGVVAALSGDKERAHAVLENFTELEKHRYISSYCVACIYAALGDFDQAFNFLERAYEDRSHLLLGLRIDPKLGGLCKDARFSNLFKRIWLR
jgi:DNA-binding winged helix-turn-helix (wHTH) protein/tetratricopeptide (TPR) repeat protein